MATLGNQSVRQPPGGSQNNTTPAAPPTMTPAALRVVGFLVGGAALVALADVAPQAAIGMTLVLGLGVLLTHADQLQSLTGAFSQATGHNPTQ